MTDKEYKKALEKSKQIAEEITIKIPASDKHWTNPNKKVKEEKVPKKNELVAIPYKVELAYEGKKRETDLEVDDPVHILLQKFREGEIDQVDLTPDDKFVMIRHMREVEGSTQDVIAEELGVTRRTVINYCNKIKQMKAQELADTTIWEIGGDLYSKSLVAMEKALQQGKYQQFAYVMSTMVSTLQSLGLVFKMPKQSQISQKITHDLTMKKGAEGFKQIQHMAAKEEVNLDNIFDELLGAVKDGKLDIKDEE